MRDARVVHDGIVGVRSDEEGKTITKIYRGKLRPVFWLGGGQPVPSKGKGGT